MLIRRRMLIGEEKFDPTAHNRVGGTIFYINSNASGNTYVFYDVDGNEIKDQSSISTLANAYYYDKVGSSTERFYVFNNSLSSGTFGQSGFTYGMTTNAIGSGKSNTATGLYWGEGTMFSSYIKGCRNSKLNGCDDWFIASNAEQDQLRSSGLVSWYSNSRIWSSVETDGNFACCWQYSSRGCWWDSTESKSANHFCFAARSF